MDTREQLLAAGMLEPATRNIAGYTLRSFSLGSMQACYMLGLSIFTDEEAQVSQAEVERQVTSFAWMHAVPEDEVIAAIGAGTVAAAVLKFSFSVPFDSVAPLLAETERIAAMIQSSAVRVEAKHKSTEEDPPGKS